MRKILHVMFSVLLVLCAASGCFASYYNEGRGGLSESDAYIIDSIADLVELRDRVNAGEDPGGAYYRMNFANKTVNLTEYTSWTPIGTGNNFTGHFDGSNHTIYMNVRLSKTGSVAALFGTIATQSGYAVKNLNVDASGDDKVLSGQYAAGIANELISNASIENCKFSGNIYARLEFRAYEANSSHIAIAGGIVQYMSAGTIKNCSIGKGTNIITVTCNSYYDTSNTATSVCGTPYAGGIVGRMYGGIIDNCTVEVNFVEAISLLDSFSFNSRTILRMIRPGYAGGIVGFGSIDDETIKNCSVSGGVFGHKYAGGIVGYLTNGVLDSNKILSSSRILSPSTAGGIGGYLNGTILNNNTVNNARVYSFKEIAGGIAGVITSGGIIENCEVTKGSKIEIEDGTEAGGIVGVLGSATVRGNTSHATISGDVSHKGGVIGKIDSSNPTIANNFYSGADYGIGYDASGSAGDIPGCTKVREGETLTKPTITTTKLKVGKVGKKYTPKMKASGTKPVTWSASGLPAGVEINESTGKFSGLPENSGTYNVRVTATNALGYDTKTFTVVINDVKPNIKGSAKAGKVGVNYLAEFYTTTGTGNIVWTLTPENLPDGLEYDYDTEGATISGTPRETWKQKYSLTATNSAGSKTKKFTLKIK